MEFSTVPHYVSQKGFDKKLQLPWDIFFTTMKLHLQFQIKVYCPIDRFQLLSALCFSWCNYCVLMRVIIDCCSQQMKKNSGIMTSPTHSTPLCFWAHCSPSCTSTPPYYLNFYSQWYTVHLPVCVRHLHFSEDSSVLKAFTTSEISLECSHFHSGPEG